MNNLRQAAQQGLEALEAMQSYAAAERKGLRICDEAITALRAALAEPEQEPAAWRTFDGEGGWDYRTYEDNENYRDEYIKRNGEKYASWVEPLYTAPTPRKPLTDLEILAANKFMYNHHTCVYIQEDGEPENLIAFARAIERAHGIGEQT